jgi:hypothetical protein
MAIDLARGMSAGIPPAGLVEMLFRIPEVEQAMRMRAKGRRRTSAHTPGNFGSATGCWPADTRSNGSALIA